MAKKARAPAEPDADKVRAKLHHAVKSTRTAVKKAKQFELQRHVRRLKQTRSAGEPTAVEEEELEIIKAIDVQAAAMRALVSKLTKSNLIPRASAANFEADEKLQRFPLLPHAEAEQLTHGTVPSVNQLARGTGADTARAERVCHQVLSSKVLADELASCIKNLSAMVKPAALEKAKSLRQEGDAESKDVGEDEDANEDVDGASDVHAADRDDSEASEGGGAPEAPDYSDSDGSGPSYANLDAMVAGGSDSEESSDESDKDEPRRPKRRRESESPTSEFLPSLATGFIPAKPGEDWSDGEVEFADTGTKGPAKPTRKNRRGQRERRAIWEKKFGKNAHHIKLRQKEKRPRPTRANPDEKLSRPAKIPRGEALQRPRPPPRPTPAPQAPAPEPKKPAEMHPSWLAKQRAKEQQGTAKPQGKKITFD